MPGIVTGIIAVITADPVIAAVITIIADITAVPVVTTVAVIPAAVAVIPAAVAVVTAAVAVVTAAAASTAITITLAAAIAVIGHCQGQTKISGTHVSYTVGQSYQNQHQKSDARK
jgi:hypothetical protein